MSNNVARGKLIGLVVGISSTVYLFFVPARRWEAWWNVGVFTAYFIFMLLIVWWDGRKRKHHYHGLL